jgi:competence protein ComEA
VCRDCHGPESVLAHLKTRDEWSKTLDEMSANGATGSDQEWTDILEYLVKHYSPIAVNKAAVAELAATLDVSTGVAEKIVQARIEKGRLTSIDELKQAAGSEAATKIEARKDRLLF